MGLEMGKDAGVDGGMSMRRDERERETTMSVPSLPILIPVVTTLPIRLSHSVPDLCNSIWEFRGKEREKTIQILLTSRRELSVARDEEEDVMGILPSLPLTQIIFPLSK